MPEILIKDLPPKLHQKLKERAAQHHRTVTMEVLAMIEDVLGDEELAKEIPAPFKGRFPLTDQIIERAKAEGRE